MNVQTLFEEMIRQEASDLFIVAGLPPSIRVNNTLRKLGEDFLSSEDTKELIHQIYDAAGNRDSSRLYGKGDDDFSFAIRGLSRFRVNTYKQRGAVSAVIRAISFSLPSPSDLAIPDFVMKMDQFSKGLVLVTGPAGSGKSTTLACMIDDINKTKEKHIITLEDPLEYLHRHNKSIVSQREIHDDTESYVTALRASLRQSPDVILLGEMRDYETIQVAMTAAETGHLIFSTLHTLGSANTIDRIIDVFPSSQQRQIAVQLSMVLQGVITQQLVPTVDNRMIPAFEVMTVTPAIRNMIRENKIPQIDGLIYSSTSGDLISMDNSLLKLYQSGIITKENAIKYSTNPDMISRKL
ncbi:twitching motility protein PilT [Aequitasia blattaphilus]|uniref:PilT/PilU family type 4a pilus ATPase n=1 Tax=Aequitasia blattaphilus TaxID=2949332 RepID=A0ABT1E949_9FIRM|nr:PilT/PilU family type 4a pilus ATPase [Aequitasia blattaphilus]MCP1102359.1 PilT/PilU family type 4a pilus ATPase [Aequitasia blattaphilus]MCR8614999.1 PilT/PilU family type 4a pilus ATPase [Aequitasia blattaphilus]